MTVRPIIWRSAIDLQEFFTNEGFRFCFIGGIAIQRWGEPRSTRDLDLTLLTGFGRESSYVSAILEHYEPRIEDAAGFALRSRVLLVNDKLNTPIDISLGGLPFEEHAVNRASMWGSPASERILTCSAEDLVVYKAFAARPRDWSDVEGILIRQGDNLNRDLILEELAPMVELKEEPEILERLEALFAANR